MSEHYIINNAFLYICSIRIPIICRLVLILVIIIVPTRQSEVTVMQSHDNQPSQDDERSQVDDNNGMYIYKCC